MGFGILLIGYFLSFATALAKRYFFADIIGGVMIGYALTKLSRYSDKFKKCIPWSMLFFGLCCIAAVLSIFKAPDLVLTVVSTVRFGSILALHVYMFKALEDMARGADDDKLADKARRNLVIISVYYSLYIIYLLLNFFVEYKIIGLISIFLYFYGLVAIFMNLFLIHSAYCRLYIEGTAEQFSPYPQFKMSKIGWIRNIQQKYYDSQKKAFDENYAIMRKSKEILDEKRKNKKKKKR